MKLIKLLTKSKFKPSLKVVLDLNFSTEDAAFNCYLIWIYKSNFIFDIHTVILLFKLKKIYWKHKS